MDNWELYYRTHKDKGSNAITGVPPLTFVSNGKNLVDYRIYGASGGVGDRTANVMPTAVTDTLTIGGVTCTCDGFGSYIFNGRANGTAIFVFAIPQFTIPVSVGGGGNGTLSFFNTKAFVGTSAILSFYYQNTLIDSWSFTDIKRQHNSYNLLSGKQCDEIRFSFQYNILTNFSCSPMFTDNGSYPVIYEPYGYKIPIVCGETTTNIYLDEPLGENESISMSDTGVSIPTINGTNILTVDTEVQPSKMYIKYGGSSNVNQSLMKYLEYKYKFAKE